MPDVPPPKSYGPDFNDTYKEKMTAGDADLEAFKAKHLAERDMKVELIEPLVRAEFVGAYRLSEGLTDPTERWAMLRAVNDYVFGGEDVQRALGDQYEHYSHLMPESRYKFIIEENLQQLAASAVNDGFWLSRSAVAVAQAHHIPDIVPTVTRSKLLLTAAGLSQNGIIALINEFGYPIDPARLMFYEDEQSALAIKFTPEAKARIDSIRPLVGGCHAYNFPDEETGEANLLYAYWNSLVDYLYGIR